MATAVLANRLDLGEANRKYATYLAYAYLLFYYVRPQDNLPGFGSIPIAGAFVGLFTVWGILHFRAFLFKTPILVIILLVLSYSISAIDASNVNAHRYAFKIFSQTLPQCLALYILFDSRERLLSLYKFWCIIYFFVAALTIKKGGLGPGDFSWDNNDAALTLSIGLPIVFYTAWHPKISKLQRYLIWGVAILIIAAIIVTSSRGGFLGLVAVLLTMWWLSEKKIRIALYAILFSVIASGAALSVLPEGYIEEMQSISDTEDDTRVERFRLWEIAWVAYKDNPVFGLGVANLRFNNSRYQEETSWYTGNEKSYQGKVVHSAYFQVLAELGTFGAAFYIYIMFIAPLKLYRTHNRLDINDESQRLAKLLTKSLIAGMAGYVVAGAFLSVAFYPHIFIWITMYGIIKRELDALPDEQVSPVRNVSAYQA